MPLPMPYTREVASHPSIAGTKSMLWHTSSPRTAWVSLIFPHFGFFFAVTLASGWKDTSHLLMLVWYKRRTSRSVSSLTRTVVLVSAKASAIWTISKSASPFTWTVSHPTHRSWSLSILMSHCLFTLLPRNSSFFDVKVMSQTKLTVAVWVPPFHLLWLQSLVDGPSS